MVSSLLDVPAESLSPYCNNPLPKRNMKYLKSRITFKNFDESLGLVPGYFIKYEPPHDKTNKMACAPRKDSDQPGHLPSLISLCCALNG